MTDAELVDAVIWIVVELSQIKQWLLVLTKGDRR